MELTYHNYIQAEGVKSTKESILFVETLTARNMVIKGVKLFFNTEKTIKMNIVHVDNFGKPSKYGIQLFQKGKKDVIKHYDTIDEMKDKAISIIKKYNLLHEVKYLGLSLD